jgi:hypothetical protein
MNRSIPFFTRRTRGLGRRIADNAIIRSRYDQPGWIIGVNSNTAGLPELLINRGIDAGIIIPAILRKRGQRTDDDRGIHPSWPTTDRI